MSRIHGVAEWTTDDVVNWLVMDDKKFSARERELATEAFNAGRSFQQVYGVRGEGSREVDTASAVKLLELQALCRRGLAEADTMASPARGFAKDAYERMLEALA